MFFTEDTIGETMFFNIFREIPEFYIDSKQPGIVRGGWFDEMGGMVVGIHAKDVCWALNEVREQADSVTSDGDD